MVLRAEIKDQKTEKVEKINGKNQFERSVKLTNLFTRTDTEKKKKTQIANTKNERGYRYANKGY